MAAGLLLEFDGVGREQYEAVNERLGIDPATGQGDWPAGLLFHAGGAKPGGWVVMEVWESQEAADRACGHGAVDAVHDQSAAQLHRRLVDAQRHAAALRRQSR